MVLASLALAVCFGTGPKQQADFSVDLFLVANNATTLNGLGWLDKPTDPATVQGLLAPVLLRLTTEKTPFVVMDGGDCSIYTSKQDRGAALTARFFSGYDSKTQGMTVNGVTKTQVLERTESISTESGTISPKPAKAGPGNVSQRFLHLSGEKPDLVLAVQDVNSFRTALQGDQAQDKQFLDSALIVSGDSLQTTKSLMRNLKPDFQGICICTWGRAEETDPNFISFPPSGMVAHYKLYRHEKNWGVQLIEYLH